VLDVDLRAVIAGTKQGIAAMRQTGSGGVIVALASAAGVFPVPHGAVYGAAKAGVVNFTRSLAPRLHKQGITMACICPQYVDTPLVQVRTSCTPAPTGGPRHHTAPCVLARCPRRRLHSLRTRRAMCPACDHSFLLAGGGGCRA
jgi:NAD(P)-dependent dehydrogenase (short-subunit alcohol dehydrogenase family)